MHKHCLGTIADGGCRVGSVMARKWIGEAVEHPGAVTQAAEAEGLTVHEWALRHRRDPGRRGEQARLALTLERLHHHRRRHTDG